MAVAEVKELTSGAMAVNSPPPPPAAAPEDTTLLPLGHDTVPEVTTAVVPPQK